MILSKSNVNANRNLLALKNRLEFLPDGFLMDEFSQRRDVTSRC